jgi:hypothetical protein
MIAASLKDAAGDATIDLLLRKGADVSIKSNSGQVRLSGQGQGYWMYMDLLFNRMRCTSQVPKPIFPPSAPCLPINVVLESRTDVVNFLFTEQPQWDLCLS